MKEMNTSAHLNSKSGDEDSSKSWQIIYEKGVTIEKRRKYIASSFRMFFHEDPLKIVKAKGQYLYDENDVEYLDCINNVAHVGHSHPKVTEACTNQLCLLNTNNRFLHDNIVQLAERLTRTLPSPLQVCYFVNSGSEANDLALRLANYYTKNRDVIVLDNAYHGHLSSLIPLSPYKYLRGNCEDDQQETIHVVPNPDSYRGLYRDVDYPDEEQLAKLYSDKVKEVCDELKSKDRHVAAFFCESMQSCAGQVIFPQSYLKKVYDYVHSAGGVCVADEVQTGFGRVGSHMWAFQAYKDSVIPDIVTIGKPMGNGYPVAAVITTKEISEAFRRGPDYFNTFGGNPVSCAVALSVLDVIEEENLMCNATVVGQFLKQSFNELKTKHNIIGDVRGTGLFLGIDLVTDRTTRLPAIDQATKILWKLRRSGILMSLDGPYNNVLKFKPPMCFNMEDAIRLVTKLDAALTESCT